MESFSVAVYWLYRMQYEKAVGSAPIERAAHRTAGEGLTVGETT